MDGCTRKTAEILRYKRRNISWLNYKNLTKDQLNLLIDRIQLIFERDKVVFLVRKEVDETSRRNAVVPDG